MSSRPLVPYAPRRVEHRPETLGSSDGVVAPGADRPSFYKVFSPECVAIYDGSCPDDPALVRLPRDTSAEAAAAVIGALDAAYYRGVDDGYFCGYDDGYDDAIRAPAPDPSTHE